MTFSDFVRFIGMTTIDPRMGGGTRRAAAPEPAAVDVRYAEPPAAAPAGRSTSPRLGRSAQPQGRSAPRGGGGSETVSAVMVREVRNLQMALTGIDTQMTGWVRAEDFAAIISELGDVSADDVGRVIANYDSRSQGVINYFQLLSDVFNLQQQQGAAAAAASASMGRAPASPARGPAGRPPPAASPAASASQLRPQSPGPRVSFEEPEPPPMRSQGAPAAQPPPSAGRLSEIVRQLAGLVTKQMGSAQAAWQKWRGGGKTLEAADLARCAGRELGVQMSLAEAQALVDRMGGQLTMGRWIQLLGSGPDALRNDEVVSAADADPDNQWLVHIARQAKGKPWEAVMRGAANPEMMCANLKKLGIFVTPPDIRPVWAKLGPEECIRRVGDFVERV